MAERKKLKAVPEVVRPENSSVGEILRAARLARGMELDEVSQTIHIRPTQLKAIEENDIESLPGMTYAVGFVRSYANFLGLNGAEIVHRFKAEQGHSPAPSKLSFPEPITESRVPDPMMVGVGAFLAVVILVGWTVYSNMHGSSKTVEQIPPAPVVTSVTDALPAAAPAPATPTAPDASAPVVTTSSTATPAPVAQTTTAPTAETPAAPVAIASQTAPSAPPTAASPVGDQPKTDQSTPDKATTSALAPTPVKEAAASPDSASEDDAGAAADKTEKKAEKKKDKDSVIKIKRGKTRITLKATQDSWVQVTDAQQNVLYKKVLRPGEQYAVPDQPGLTLDTANAGGLDIIVDGKQVQPVGKDGEIVRDITLDPQKLKIKRMQVRD